MVILYIFRLKKIDKKQLNNVKRRFYYNFKKINNLILFKIFNKDQIFIINEENEEKIDNFLNSFLDWIEYYKIKSNNFIFISNKNK